MISTVFIGCDGCDGFPMADLNMGVGVLTIMQTKKAPEIGAFVVDVVNMWT